MLIFQEAPPTSCERERALRTIFFPSHSGRHLESTEEYDNIALISRYSAIKTATLENLPLLMLAEPPNGRSTGTENEAFSRRCCRTTFLRALLPSAPPAPAFKRERRPLRPLLDPRSRAQRYANERLMEKYCRPAISNAPILLPFQDGLYVYALRVFKCEAKWSDGVER